MKDFFISYNKADETWAEWIAWLLEGAGYSVLIQAWDFRPGENFVLKMQRATMDSHRTIIVLSDNYLNASYTHPEWAVAFARDPQGQDRQLIPIRVEPCEPKGLLAPLIYIDIVGVPEQNARPAILDALSERAKPAEPPTFPGGDKRRGNPPSVDIRGRQPIPPLSQIAGTNHFLTAEPAPSQTSDGEDEREQSPDELKIWKDILRAVLEDEIPVQLNKISPSSSLSILRQLKRLTSNTLFMRNIASPSVFFDDINKSLQLSEPHLFGYTPDFNTYAALRDNSQQPIKIYFPPIFLGVSAIFFYLRDVKGCNLELEFHFPHALSIVSQLKELSKGNGLIKTPPQACVVGDAPGTSLSYLSNELSYGFRLLMPPSEHQIITPKLNVRKRKDSVISKGQFFFPQRADILSTPLLSLHNLINAKAINPGKIKTLNCEPNEWLEISQSGERDCFSIMWTPQWQLYRRLGLCDVWANESLNKGGKLWYNTILYLQKSFHLNVRARYLEIAIRDAWITLRSSPNELKRVITSMLSEPDYPVALLRFCGLDGYNLAHNGGLENR